MKKFAIRALALVAASTIGLAGAAQATLVYDFQLNGSFSNAAGAGTLIGNGGTLGATGYSFAASQGLSLVLPGTLSVYTVQMAFRFDKVSGYNRILDYKDLSSDGGFYILNGQLNFYPVITAGAAIAANENIVTTISRDAAGMVTATLNGVTAWTFDDSAGAAIFNASIARFFIDDVAVGGEASGGFADYIRIYDTATIPPVTPPVPGVPEPASWAMMIGGLGLVGAAMRRKSLRVTFA